MPFAIRQLTYKIFLGSALLAASFNVGCGGGSITTGGDSPVTPQRLSGAKLTDIQRDVSWTFSPSTVTIENAGQPLPADVVDTLLGNATTCSTIEATWKLNEKAGVLELTQFKVDDSDLAHEVAVPIAPAGHVRANLGSRQYNIQRAK